MKAKAEARMRKVQVLAFTESEPLPTFRNL